jgi:hypothetical protein
LSLLEEKYLKLNSGLSLLMPSCGWYHPVFSSGLTILQLHIASHI